MYWNLLALKNKCRGDIRDITVMKNTEPGSDKIWILKLSFINIIWNLRSIPRRKCVKDLVHKFLGRSDGSLEEAETDTTSYHPCCKVARPLGNLLSGGRGELGAQYEIRSPLPAMSLSISKIRKREARACCRSLIGCSISNTIQ